MMSQRARASMRLLTLIAMVALALFVVACGGSDDDTNGDQASTPQEQTDTGSGAEDSGGTETDAEEPAEPRDGGEADSGDDGGDEDVDIGGDEEEQAAAAVNGLYDALGSGDAEAACAVMTEQMQNQVAQGAAGAGKADASCEETFGKFLDTAEKSGGLTQVANARVIKVEVKGDNATATVKFGKQSGQIPVVEQDGEWKVGTFGATGGTQQQGSTGE